MNQKRLREIFDYNPKEGKVFIPNEIFDILKENISKAPHISFAYSYLYLCTWLYRYAKHFNVELFDNKKIKEILGYSANNQSLDYLIKKDGLLDRIECTESTKDYPIRWNYNSKEGLTFEMASSYKDYSEYMNPIPKRFFLKYPTKGFYRIGKDVEGNEYEYQGTFYDVSNTHEIPFEVFMYCMSNREIGCTGFYLYSYIKQKNDYMPQGYGSSLDRLAKDTGLSRRSLNSYMDVLKGYRMIDFKHNQEYYVIGLDSNERKSNSYIARSYEFFEKRRKPYKKISFITEKKYNEMKENSKRLNEEITSQMPNF